MSWKWVEVVEQKRGRFALRLPITGSRVDQGVLRAMKLDPATKTEGLTRRQAEDLAAKVEAWRCVQEADRPRKRG